MNRQQIQNIVKECLSNVLKQARDEIPEDADNGIARILVEGSLKYNARLIEEVLSRVQHAD